MYTPKIIKELERILATGVDVVTICKRDAATICHALKRNPDMELLKKNLHKARLCLYRTELRID